MTKNEGLSYKIYEDIGILCEKIIDRKKTSKVIRLSHEELVMIRYALIYAIQRLGDGGIDHKTKKALEIILTKIYRYE